MVQEHTGLSATRILILGFPRRNQQKRHCYTDRHECHKPTDANKTPQMANRFYLRPRLLCRLALWDCFTSSRFVVPQSTALESSLAPQIPPSLWSSHRSSTKQMASLTSILSWCSCYHCVCSWQQQVARAFANGGRAFWATQ